MKRILISSILLVSSLVYSQGKLNGNKTVEGNLHVNGNITVDGTLPSSTPSETALIPTRNIFDASLLRYGQSVNATNGNVGADGSRDSSGRQKVEPNTRYYITLTEFPTGVHAPTSALRAFYDVNGDYVNWSNLALEADGSWITPANVHYAEWSFNQGNFTPLMQLIEADDLVTPVTFDGGKATTTGQVFDPLKVNIVDAILRRIVYPLFGKKWLSLGDSITQQNKYAVFLKRVTGLIQFRNYGFAGRLIGDMASTDLTQADVDEADVITIYGGTNNYGLGTEPLGTIADASSVNSFYGRMRKELEIIYGFIETSTLTNAEKNDKIILVITPVHRGTAQGYTPPAAGAGGKTLLEIRNAMIEVSAEFGTPVYDAYANSGLNAVNISRNSDELHPLDEASTYGIGIGKTLNFHYKGY